MLEDGYLRVARPAGVEVRLHWSVAVGALLSARLRLEPVLWLGYFAVLFTHELGHVLAVKSLGAQLVGIDVNGVGGSCRWRGSNGLVERAWVAWGGVLAQALLLGVVLLLCFGLGVGTSPWGAQLRYSWFEVNLAVLAVNLLPLSPFDGALAWRLFAALRADDRTLRGTLLGALWLWAHRRRQRRSGQGSSEPEHEAGEASSLGGSGAARDAGSGASTALDTPYDPAGTDQQHAERYRPATAGEDVEEEGSPEPSAEAQRELDALLRRMRERAERGRGPR
ncbi:MAG TPA: M50 family metallopeptidase [Polyangiaceae bacterium]|nr:M50 family metallopeptidase [Polyangiaceae bacterium]